MSAAVPVILYATFTARSGNEAVVADLLCAYAASVRREPGNVLFQASHRLDEPGSFFVYEEYVDEAAFQTHLATSSGKLFNAKLGPLIVEPQSRLTFLRAVSPGIRDGARQPA